jgi:hypothetical protein
MEGESSGRKLEFPELAVKRVQRRQLAAKLSMRWSLIGALQH